MGTMKDYNKLDKIGWEYFVRSKGDPRAYKFVGAAREFKENALEEQKQQNNEFGR